MAISVSLIYSVAGEPIGISSIVRDITADKQAEQVAMQLAAIVESSSEAIIGLDLAGKITNWNTAAEKLYGYAAEDAIGKSAAMLSPTELQDELYTLLGKVARGERLKQYQTTHLLHDSQQVVVSLTISPIIHARTDRVTGVSMIASCRLQ